MTLAFPPVGGDGNTSGTSLLLLPCSSMTLKTIVRFVCKKKVSNNANRKVYKNLRGLRRRTGTLLCD
jgi:hypothetical protein